MPLPSTVRPVTVTDEYLKAIHEELVALNARLNTKVPENWDDAGIAVVKEPARKKKT